MSRKNKINILFLSDNFTPEVNAPATRTLEHCREWVNQGVDVTVITCVPNFPRGKVFDGYQNKLYQTEYIDGIKIIRVWSYMSANSGFIRRTLDYISYAFMAFCVGLFQKHDIVVATSPQFFTTWAGWGISKIKRKPWVFELRDIWPESIKAVGEIKSGKIYDYLEQIELALYKNSSKVIAVTNAFKSNLISRGIDAQKIEVISNGSNMEFFSAREKDITLLSELKLENKFIVGYLGTHGLAHGLDFIIRSIHKITDKDIHFLFIGDGASKNKIITLAEDLHLTNITFLDPISKDKMPQYLSIVDVSLAPLKRSDTFKTVVPSKIFEASAMQKPTLLGVEGQAQEIIEQYGAGLCYIPEDENDFIDKVIELKKNRSLYIACQQGCVKLAKDFDRQVLANKMLKILQDIM